MHHDTSKDANRACLALALAILIDAAVLLLWQVWR